MLQPADESSQLPGVKMGKLTIFIDEDGMTHGLASPLTKALGLEERRRVSHVEPVNRALRWLFHAIRRRVSDESKAAAFTRRWPCKWQANIFNGPTLGPFNDRAAAITAEISCINSQLEKETHGEEIKFG